MLQHFRKLSQKSSNGIYIKLSTAVNTNLAITIHLFGVALINCEWFTVEIQAPTGQGQDKWIAYRLCIITTDVYSNCPLQRDCREESGAVVALGHAKQVHPGVSVLLRWNTYQNRQGLTQGLPRSLVIWLRQRCEVRARQLRSQTGISI